MKGKEVRELEGLVSVRGTGLGLYELWTETTESNA